jgi:hypothetical protein
MADADGGSLEGCSRAMLLELGRMNCWSLLSAAG